MTAPNPAPAPGIRLPQPTYLVAVTSFVLPDGNRNLQTMALDPLAPEDAAEMIAWLFSQPPEAMNLANAPEAVLVLNRPFDSEAFADLAVHNRDIDALPGFVGVLTPADHRVAVPAAEWN